MKQLRRFKTTKDVIDCSTLKTPIVIYDDQLNQELVPNQAEGTAVEAFVDTKGNLNCRTHLGNNVFRYISTDKLTIEVVQENFDSSIKTNIYEDLGQLQFEDIVTSVPYLGFSYTVNLKEMVLPEEIDSIEDEAFEGCENLDKIVISNSLKSIGSSAFSECFNLSAITFNGSKEEWEAVEKDEDWNSGAAIFEIICNDGVIEQSISDDMILYRTTDNTIASISPSALNAQIYAHTYTKAGIIKLMPGQQLTLINHQLFTDGSVEISNNVYEIHLPNTVENICPWAFAYAGILGKFVLPVNLKRIGEKAFLYNKNIGEFVLPETIERVESGAFTGCSSLNKINIPASLTKLEHGVFGGTGIKEFVIPSTVTEMEGYVFGGSSIENITIDASLTVIPESTFSYARKLKNVVISHPELIKALYACAFGGTESLESITHMPNLKMIDSRAIYYSKKLGEFTVPSSVIHLANDNFTDMCIGKLTIDASISTLAGAVRESKIEEFYLSNAVTAFTNESFYASQIGKFNFNGTKDEFLNIYKDNKSFSTKKLEAVDCIDGSINVSDYNYILYRRIDQYNDSPIGISGGYFYGSRIILNERITQEFIDAHPELSGYVDTTFYILRTEAMIYRIDYNYYDNYFNNINYMVIPGSMRFLRIENGGGTSGMSTIYYNGTYDEFKKVVKPIDSVVANVVCLKDNSTYACKVKSFKYKTNDGQPATFDSLANIISDVQLGEYRVATSSNYIDYNNRLFTSNNVIELELPEYILNISSYNCGILRNYAGDSFTYNGYYIHDLYWDGVTSVKHIKISNRANNDNSISWSYRTSVFDTIEVEKYNPLFDTLYKNALVYRSSADLVRCAKNFKDTNITKDSYIYMFSVGAFSYCNMEGFEMPESVKWLDDSVFEYASSLGEFTLDEHNFTSMGDRLFSWSDIKKLNLLNAYAVRTSLCHECHQLEEINVDTTLSFPIRQYAFYGDTSLHTVSTPKSKISSVDMYAFYNCTSLKNIDLSEAYNIGSGAFYHCDSLESYESNARVFINEYAFRYSGLKSIKLHHDEYIYFSSYAFGDCDNLALVDVTINATMGFNNNAFAMSDNAVERTYIFRTPNVPYLPSVETLGISNKIKAIYVNDNMVNTFKQASTWAMLSGKIKPISEYENNLNA